MRIVQGGVCCDHRDRGCLGFLYAIQAFLVSTGYVDRI